VQYAYSNRLHHFAFYVDNILPHVVYLNEGHCHNTGVLAYFIRVFCALLILSTVHSDFFETLEFSAS
jgi:hypothetical protein